MLLVNKFAWIFYRSDILRVVNMVFEVEKYHNWNNYNDQDADSQNYQNLLHKKRILFNTILSPTCFGVTKNSLLDHFLIKKFGIIWKNCTIEYEFSDHIPTCLSFVYKRATQNCQSTGLTTNHSKITTLFWMKIFKVLTGHQFTDTILAFDTFIEIIYSIHMFSCTDLL